MSIRVNVSNNSNSIKEVLFNDNSGNLKINYKVKYSYVVKRTNGENLSDVFEMFKSAGKGEVGKIMGMLKANKDEFSIEAV